MAMSTSASRAEFPQRDADLQQLLADETSPLSVEALLDALCAIYEECHRLENRARLPAVQSFVTRYAPLVSKLSSLRLSIADFKVIKMLGRGAYGEVNLCACHFDGQYYAIKKLKKSKMLQSQEAFYMEERELLALAKGHWITTLEYAFQDDEYLYLVMEYLAGGNLLNLLYKQTLDHGAVRFYAAETVLGVREIHNLGFVYRDLKPDNMLLDRTGHLKLADFGSCVRLDKDHLVHSSVPVGTPYYIAPEVLRAQEGHEPTGSESDWWSLGIVLYEMFVGDPPFYSESLLETYSMIMNHKKALKFPDDVEVPPHAVDLIKRLVCDRAERLTVEGIMSHPFFAGVDWEGIRNQTPPFVPELRGPDDTSHFDEDFDQVDPSHDPKTRKPGAFTGENLSFVGYTFRRGNGRPGKMMSVTSTASGLDVLATPDVIRRSDSSADIKKLQQDSERWLAKYKHEKQRAEAAEALRDTLAADAERKERALASEAAAHARADEHIVQLEKNKAVTELELDELQRKLASGQRERQAIQDRVQELEMALLAAETKRDDLIKSLSGQAADQVSFDADLRQYRKRLEEQTAQLATLADQLAEEQRRKQALEKDLAAVSASLAAEQSLRADAEVQLREARKALADLTTKEAKLQAAADKRDKEVDGLNAELHRLQTSAEADAGVRTGLQKAKADLEGRKAMLELQVSQLQSQVAKDQESSAALVAKIAILEQALAKEPATPEAPRSPERTSVASALANEALAKERQARERVEAKLAELSVEKAALATDMAALTTKLAAEVEELDAVTTKLARLQKILEKKIDDELDLEEKLEDSSSKVVSLTTEVETLQRAIDHNLKTTTRLEAVRKETEAERDTAETKMLAMKKKYETEVEERQRVQSEFEVLAAKSLKDRQALLAAQSELEAANASKDLNLREQEKLRKRLGELQTEHDAQEQAFAALRRDKAVLDLQLGQLEKRALADAERNKALETRIDELSKEALANASLSAQMADSNDKLTVEKEALEDSLRKATETVEALEASVKTLTARNDQIGREKELATASVRDMLQRIEQNAPKSAQQDKKEYRKLKETYTTLQRNYKTLESRVADEEAKRKKAEATLAEEEGKRRKAELMLAEVRKGSDAVSEELKRSGSLNRSQSIRSIASTSDHSEGTGITSFFRRATTMRVPKVLTINAKTSTEFHITANGFEGFLKMPKERGIRYGWTKQYVVVRDTRMYHVDKEKEKDKVSDDALIADFKSHVVIFRDPPLDVITLVTSAEAVSTFGLYVSRPSSASAATSTGNGSAGNARAIAESPATAAAVAGAAASSPAPHDEKSLATIQATLKTKEKELAVEEKLLQGASALLRASAQADQKKQAQRQVDGSQARVDQLRRDVTRLKDMEKAAMSLAAASSEANGKPTPAMAQATVQLKINALRESIKVETDSVQTFSMVNTNLPKEIVADFKENVRHTVAFLQGELDKWTALASDSALTEEKVAAVEAQLAAQYREFSGHKYLPRKFANATRCQICVQVLHQTSQALECSICKYAVHKECYPTGGHTCQEVAAAQRTRPVIFMAADETDCERWLSNLVALRDSVSSGSFSDGVGSGLPSPTGKS